MRLEVEYLHSSAKTGYHGDGVCYCREKRAAADDAVNVLLVVNILATGDVSEEEKGDEDEDDLAVRHHFFCCSISNDRHGTGVALYTTSSSFIIKDLGILYRTMTQLNLGKNIQGHREQHITFQVKILLLFSLV